MAGKKVTIEDLAAMVQKGFEETARKDEMDKRFDEVDKRFDEVDKRFGSVEGRLVNIESDVAYLKARVGEISRTLEEHSEVLEEHSEELRWLHKKMDEFADPRGDKHAITYKEFTKLETRVATLEKKVAAKIL